MDTSPTKLMLYIRVMHSCNGLRLLTTVTDSIISLPDVNKANIEAQNKNSMFIVIGGSAGGGFVVLIFIPALILTIVGCWKWRKRRSLIHLKRAVNSKSKKAVCAVNHPLPCTPFGESPICTLKHHLPSL